MFDYMYRVGVNKKCFKNDLILLSTFTFISVILFYPDMDLDNDKETVNTDSDLLESPMSDGLMEDNFEEILGTDIFQPDLDADDADNDNRIEEEEEDDFADISKYGIIEIAGTWFSPLVCFCIEKAISYLFQCIILNLTILCVS